MRRLSIAIDCDDVLADNAAGFVAFSNKTWGTNLRAEDYDEHWAKVWGVDHNETEKRATHIHDSGVFRSYSPVDQALPTLRKLAKSHDLCIVTSRRMQVRDDTVNWIHEHYPGVFKDDTIYFAGIWDSIDDTSILKDKSGIVDSINADVLVDDQLKHCLAVANGGREAILFGDFSWNKLDKLPNGVTRCVDWLAVKREIERIAAA